MTMLDQQPSVHFTRFDALKTFADLSSLHDDLLSTLNRVVPFAEYEQRTANIPTVENGRQQHARWSSADVVPSRRLTAIRKGRRSLSISRSSADDDFTLGCSPAVVALAAKTFSQLIERFTIYEEYGANYEAVQRDVEDTQRAMAAWSDFDRAIEVLTAHVNPVKSREANRRKALTIKDLLIKPIQRLPRYELVFSDLCKLTPVCDDPDANAVIRDLLVQLNGACQRMNTAKDDPTRARVYPGIRASANHVIRKFSMASITSNFSSSKRTASYTSFTHSRRDDQRQPSRKRRGGEPRMPSSRRSGAPLVDFHNAPDAFLPTDFELNRSKKSALRTFTMSMERPFTPLLGNDSKSAGPRRAQSVRDMGGAARAPALAPVYSVGGRDEPRTPAAEMSVLTPRPEKEPEPPVKTPRKSKSRLMRFFG